MIDVDKVQLIAQSYSPQELFAALVWQRRFNEFANTQSHSWWVCLLP